MWGLDEVAKWTCRALRQLGVAIEGPRALTVRTNGKQDTRIALMGKAGKIVLRFCRKDPKAGTWHRYTPHVLVKPMSWRTRGKHMGHKYIGSTLEFKCDRITDGFGNPSVARMGSCTCLACEARRRILELFYREEVRRGNEKAPFNDCQAGI